MRKFPLFASIHPELVEEGKREGNIHLLRNKILQSDDLLRFSKWRRHDFLKSLGRGKVPYKNRYFCILCISASFEFNDINIYVESGEKFSLLEALVSIENSEYPLAIIFIYCDKKYKKEIEDKIRSFDVKNICFFISDNDVEKFMFALSCEITNWWELESSCHQNVSFAHILKCVKTIINNYTICSNNKGFEISEIDFTIDINRIAWANGTNYCEDTDIEKIKNNARIEQIADAIKRIFDSASHPREEHLTPQERLICSQGLFWLSELDDVNDVKNWILDTRFYKEISSENINLSILDNTLPIKTNIDPVILLKFFESFVHVPSDEYKFGTNKLNIESEPPANAFKSYLNEYKILRFPVTEALWALIIDDGTPESDYPKVNVNFFEANCYANVLTDLFKKYFPNEFVNKKVTLPNEYQWETAGRSKHEYEYPWGNKFDQSLCNCEMTIGATTKVGKYSPLGDSKFGCHDMAGNVREWTRSYGGTKGIDWKLHSNDNFLNNINIVSSSRLIIKGGSYSYSFDCVVCWMRNTQIASRKDCQTGFRLVIENI